jgi:enoyl-CoA hydratase/carnithine racemase
MSDIDIRITGRAGRITLTRPQALNAMTYEMCLAIEAALLTWRDDPAVKLVIIDAEGDKAFCAGGDIAELYAKGRAGDYAYGQKFWRDEYRLNALIFEYPKPYVAFMQGFTMGGGVGISCHGSHRIVCATSRIAMPECGIGLVPDVGGSLILANAPGHLGEYLGTTAARMGPADAILAGFADTYIDNGKWPDLIESLENTGDTSQIAAHSEPPPQGGMSGLLDEINHIFSGNTLSDILTTLRRTDTCFARETFESLSRCSPLSVACTIEMIHSLRGSHDIRDALKLEYRFTYRAQQHADFIEGIRAAIIDKDRSPKWRYSFDNLPQSAVSDMLAPLGENGLTFERETP